VADGSQPFIRAATYVVSQGTFDPLHLHPHA